jgi:hypothetical protein
MSLRKPLSLEQYAVMIVAEEEGYLYNVLDEYGMRLRWAKSADTRLPSDLDDDDKLALVPRFGEVLDDLVGRGWIEVYEPSAVGVNGYALVLEHRRREILSDPSNWIRRDGEDVAMIQLVTTDAWQAMARPER